MEGASVKSRSTIGAPSADGARSHSEPQQKSGGLLPAAPNRSWAILALMLAVNWTLMRALYPTPSVADVSYTFFTEQVGTGNVSEVISQGDVIQGTFKKAVNYPATAPMTHDVTRFSTVRPAFATSNLEQLLEQHGVVINARALDEGQPTWWENLIYGFAPTLLLVGGFVWLSRRASSGAGLFRLRKRQLSARRTLGRRQLPLGVTAPR